jgi:hypothetical protein
MGSSSMSILTRSVSITVSTMIQGTSFNPSRPFFVEESVNLSNPDIRKPLMMASKYLTVAIIGCGKYQPSSLK